MQRVAHSRSLPRTVGLPRWWPALPALLATDPAFCLAAAALMLLMRLVIFDYPVFFGLQSIPNHDMYEGAPFFATAMHSLRISGDIPWWNPSGWNGYAQYYQAFLSPLAPTAHHVVFIVWAQAVRGLSALGVGLPEYFQYLAVNYVVLPFLTFASVAAFLSLLFKHRAVTLLVLVAYVFSAIGLWNSSWFYYQEPFTLFALLAALVAALQKPTPRRLCILVAALTVQLASTNYWTIYNVFFVAAMIGSYGFVHPNQVRRAFVRTVELARHRRLVVLSVGLLSAGAVVLWLSVVASIVIEQARNFTRGSEGMTLMDGYGRVSGLVPLTTLLFREGDVRRLVDAGGPVEYIHHARYIGAAFLPLLLLLPFYPWRRRERWLALWALLVLVVCLGPPLLLIAWKDIPFLFLVRHIFNFYPHYWALMVVLLAGASLDRLLEGSHGRNARRAGMAILGTIVGGVGLLLLFTIGLGGGKSLPVAVIGRESEFNLRFGLVLCVASVAILQVLLAPRRGGATWLAVVMLALGMTDLTRYFWEVSILENRYTDARWGGVGPLSGETQAVLRRPWSDPKPAEKGFEAGLFDNMPIPNDFWPVNTYMRHRFASELLEMPEAFQATALAERPLQFYGTAVRASGADPRQAIVEQMPELLVKDQALLIQADGDQACADPALHPSLAKPSSARPARGFPEIRPIGNPDRGICSVQLAPNSGGGFSYRWRQWDYNGFDFGLRAPRDGWVLVRQLADPAWRVTLDGQPVQALRANFVGMAVPVTSGAHEIRLEYWPFARRVYWPAGVLLEVTLVVLAALAMRPGAGRPLRRAARLAS